MNTGGLTWGLGLGGGGERGTSWEQIWQTLPRLLREEYVKNESEYRKFKYLIPALILFTLSLFFRLKIYKNSHLFHPSLPTRHAMVTVPGTTSGSPRVKRGDEKSSTHPPLPWYLSPHQTSPLTPLQEATIVGFLAPEWLMGPKPLPGLLSSPREATEFSEMMQARCGFKVLAQVQTLWAQISSWNKSFLSHPIPGSVALWELLF